MANTIKFNIDLVVDGKRQLVQATTDVRMLGEELARGKKRAADFGVSLQGLTQIGLTFNGLVAGIQSLRGALRVYTEATRRAYSHCSRTVVNCFQICIFAGDLATLA